MLIVVHNCCCYCYFYDVFVVVVLFLLLLMILLCWGHSFTDEIAKRQAAHQAASRFGTSLGVVGYQSLIQP